MQRISFYLLLLTLLCSLPAAAQKQKSRQKQKGKATYYSRRATGARSASGKRIHHDSLICAHRTYPFGTRLLVRNPANGKEVVVTVIDRGPFGKGKIIDLSLAAARKLGMVSQGVALVEVEKLENTHAPYRINPDDMPKLEIADFTDKLTYYEPEEVKKKPKIKKR